MILLGHQDPIMDPDIQFKLFNILIIKSVTFALNYIIKLILESSIATTVLYLYQVPQLS